MNKVNFAINNKNRVVNFKEENNSLKKELRKEKEINNKLKKNKRNY